MSTGLVTPADWANIASEGKWEMQPHLDILNRKFMDIAASRARREKTRSIISLPPRMGKSQFFSEYGPGWWLGTFPEDRVMVTAYQDDFAMEWGQKARNAFKEWAPRVFGLGLDPERTASSRWGIEGHRGEMQTAGAGGALMGKGPEFMVIDDPIKDAMEALSETRRQQIWNWYITSVRTRIEPGGAIVIIMQRWHEDDIVGRLKTKMEDGTGEPWDVIEMPAIAEENDILGRPVGTPLWPSKMDIAELESIRRNDPYWFAAQYQQNPRPVGGAFFKRAWFKDKMIELSDVPRDAETCRFWDKAASEGKGDYTSGTRMSRSKDGRYFVEHVARARLSPHRRNELIFDTTADDSSHCDRYRVRADQDPGSAGKDESEAFCRMLDRFDVKATRITGDKATRARPFASACERGDVYVVEGTWNAAFFDELEAFRDDGKNKHDDQVDSTAGAYNELAGNDNALRIADHPFGNYQGRLAREDANAPRNRRRSSFRMVGLG